MKIIISNHNKKNLIKNDAFYTLKMYRKHSFVQHTINCILLKIFSRFRNRNEHFLRCKKHLENNFSSNKTLFNSFVFFSLYSATPIIQPLDAF